MAALLLSQGDLGGAGEHYRESLRLARVCLNRFLTTVALAGLAEVARLGGNAEQAARLCGAAAAVGDIRLLATAPEMWQRWYQPTDWLEYGRTMEAVRELSSDATTAAAWAEGERMPLEQAVAYASALA